MPYFIRRPWESHGISVKQDIYIFKKSFPFEYIDILDLN